MVITAEEYLALDRAAEFRSEFLDGEIVAMSGGSKRHSRLQINLVMEVSTALRGSSCEVFNSDLRVRVSPRMYTYPDLTMSCEKGTPADEREDILLNPTVIFEVLSPSTEYYDRVSNFTIAEKSRRFKTTSWCLRIKSALSNSPEATPTLGRFATFETPKISCESTRSEFRCP